MCNDPQQSDATANSTRRARAAVYQSLGVVSTRSLALALISVTTMYRQGPTLGAALGQADGTEHRPPSPETHAYIARIFRLSKRRRPSTGSEERQGKRHQHFNRRPSLDGSCCDQRTANLPQVDARTEDEASRQDRRSREHCDACRRSWCQTVGGAPNLEAGSLTVSELLAAMHSGKGKRAKRLQSRQTTQAKADLGDSIHALLR